MPVLTRPPADERPAALGHRGRVLLLTVVALAALIVLALGGWWLSRPPRLAAVLATPYQAVFLTSGQVFIGKLEGFPGPYPVLRDAYYFQTQVNPETKQPQASLIRRGKEWHAPQAMVINASHILFVETVAPDSAVAKLIEESRGRGPRP